MVGHYTFLSTFVKFESVYKKNLKRQNNGKNQNSYPIQKLLSYSFF